MALITYPECGQNVSDHADACPNCGYPVKLIHREMPNQRGNSKQAIRYDDIPEEEPDYIADCFDGDWQMFEDNYSD